MAEAATVPTAREKLAAALAALRKQGYFARMSWKCCMTCGCAAIPQKKSERYVFAHSQKMESFGEDGELRSDLYLHWSGDPVVIVTALREVGLDAVRPLSEAECVRVVAPRHEGPRW
jgi:hypothetical protein